MYKGIISGAGVACVFIFIITTGSFHAVAADGTVSSGGGTSDYLSSSSTKAFLGNDKKAVTAGEFNVELQCFRSNKPAAISDMPIARGVDPNQKDNYNLQCNHQYAFSNALSIYNINVDYHERLVEGLEKGFKGLSDAAKAAKSLSSAQLSGSMPPPLATFIGLDSSIEVHGKYQADGVCYKGKQSLAAASAATGGSGSGGGASRDVFLSSEQNDEDLSACKARLKRAVLTAQMQLREATLDAGSIRHELIVDAEKQKDEGLAKVDDEKPTATILNDLFLMINPHDPATGKPKQLSPGSPSRTDVFQAELDTSTNDFYDPSILNETLNVAGKETIDNRQIAQQQNLEDGVETAKKTTNDYSKPEDSADALDKKREDALKRSVTGQDKSGKTVTINDALKKSYENDKRRAKQMVKEKEQQQAKGGTTKGKVAIKLEEGSIQFAIFKQILDGYDCGAKDKAAGTSSGQCGAGKNVTGLEKFDKSGKILSISQPIQKGAQGSGTVRNPGVGSSGQAAGPTPLDESLNKQLDNILANPPSGQNQTNELKNLVDPSLTD